MSDKPLQCDHKEFETVTGVCRETDAIGSTTVIGYSASIQIHCLQCGVRMRFLGLPTGSLIKGAAVSFDGTEARLAMEPEL